MLKQTFLKIKDIYAYPCVTILYNTHRTKPDNRQDPITLKNLITEVENRLDSEFNFREITKLKASLKAVQEMIDHNYNLESMAIFVSNDVCEYVRLPISVEERTVIDHTFATRDLLRALHQSGNYYILTISQRNGRLYEAFNDEILEEIKEGKFPVENETLYLTKKEEIAVAKKVDDTIREFLNRIDKEFNPIYNRNPLEVIIAGTERNFHFYQEIMDRKKVIAGWINQNRDDFKPHEIVKDAWPVMLHHIKEQQQSAISELEQAVSQQKFVTGISESWRAVNEGRGEKLFVEKNYFQPAILKEDAITFVDDAKETGVIDDIIDELIERQLQFGGQVVFLEDGSLSQYNRLALKLRY
jgi:hypothetical protein